MRRAIPFDTTAKRQSKYRLQQQLIIAKQKCGCAKRQKSSPVTAGVKRSNAVSDNSYRCFDLQHKSKNSVTLERTRTVLADVASDAAFLTINFQTIRLDDAKEILEKIYENFQRNYSLPNVRTEETIVIHRVANFLEIVARIDSPRYRE